MLNYVQMLLILLISKKDLLNEDVLDFQYHVELDLRVHVDELHVLHVVLPGKKLFIYL